MNELDDPDSVSPATGGVRGYRDDSAELMNVATGAPPREEGPSARKRAKKPRRFKKAREESPAAAAPPANRKLESQISYSDLVHDPKLRLTGRGEAEDWGETAKPKGLSIAWILGCFVIVLATIALSLHYRNVLGEKDPDVNFLGMPALSIEPRDANAREEKIADLLGREDEARELFDRFLRSNSLREVMKMVRIQPGVDYLAARYSWHAPLPPGWQVPENTKWKVHSNCEPPYAVLEGFFPDESPFRGFFTLENGRLYLDWKATVAYRTASFEELSKGQGDGTEIRAWLEPAVFYTPAYPESEFDAFRIYSALDDPVVWGYVKKSSAISEQLKTRFSKSMILEDQNRGPKMYLLSMKKRNDGEASNQWLITDLLHTEWIQP